MSLKRELGLFDAVMLGLGSIIGTGVFVSIAIAADVAGAGVVAAVGAAALVATCNALSSAQLAARHPVSGGTYEYGYLRLAPWLGFAAGWMFLCAKTASAATAALGFSGYLLAATRWKWPVVAVAVATAAAMTAVVLAGAKRSSRVNMAIVSVTLASLLAFVLAGLPEVAPGRLAMTFEPRSWMHATALMFVAFTGYGRIATLGEEVVDPQRTIPRAIVVSLVTSAALYAAVAAVYVGTAGGAEAKRLPEDRGGPTQLAASSEPTARDPLRKSGSPLRSERPPSEAAPLETAARSFSLNVSWLVAVGAMTAMLGVLLNLLLGLSRMLLAMGRRGDMPRAAANVDVAVVAVGVLIAGMASLGDVKTTWSFSAFTVLVYYAVTNLAALRLTAEERLFSRAWAWCGLAACLSLAFAVEVRTWATGLAVLAVGMAWHAWRRRGHADEPAD